MLSKCVKWFKVISSASLAGLQKACGRGSSHACVGSTLNRNLPFTRHRSFQKISRQRFSPIPYTAAELHTRDPQVLGEFAITQATKLKVLIDSICEVEAYPRGDNKELLDLMEAYIGLNER